MACNAVAGSGYADSEFAACVSRLKQAARDADISEEAISVLDKVEPSERVLELDRRQPEFTQTFADYFNRRVTTERVARGRELLVKHTDLLQGVQARYGVPPQYLLSFWGLETNFGSYLGKMSIPDSLATLACDARRGRFFEAELISALELIDSDEVTYEAMQGSWAGAMGHMQFMPSAYIDHAVDGDGDGRRDLWSSEADALNSAANLLVSKGWKTGLRWGREVRLPDSFDYALASREKTLPLSRWQALGVTNAFGDPLPAAHLEAALVIPAGHGGPAFLIYDNFEVIMRWNRSEFYALSVGYLADRIAGAGRLQRPPPGDDLKFSTDQMIEIQSSLKSLGYSPGEPDGIYGPATRRAVSRFQGAHGLVADGYVNQPVLDAINASAESLDSPVEAGPAQPETQPN